LVSYYSVHKLKRLKQWLVYLYLLCFVTHRYRRLHDNLINSLLYNTRCYGDEAKAVAKEAVAKEKVYECQLESNQNLRKSRSGAETVYRWLTDKSPLYKFNARHSPKYFGLKKGIVAYTLVAEPPGGLHG
jgi:hypothetical protein